MTISLRDQLLGLGFKDSPKPKRDERPKPPAKDARTGQAGRPVQGTKPQAGKGGRHPPQGAGRHRPREDIDLWEFDAAAGTTVTAFVHAQSLNSPLLPRLDILDAKGSVVAEQMLHACAGTDASVKFTPRLAGKYRVRITDANTNGGQAYVYRLTVTTPTESERTK